MFSVTISESIMIAHSLRGEIFGPAQRLHGATFVVEVELMRGALDENDIVADMGHASDLLSEVLAPLTYRNLDDLSDFAGRNTTAEFLAFAIFERYRDGIRDGRLGGDTRDALDGMTVTLRETPDGLGLLFRVVARNGVAACRPRGKRRRCRCTSCIPDQLPRRPADRFTIAG